MERVGLGGHERAEVCAFSLNEPGAGHECECDCDGTWRQAAGGIQPPELVGGVL